MFHLYVFLCFIHTFIHLACFMVMFYRRRCLAFRPSCAHAHIMNGCSLTLDRPCLDCSQHRWKEENDLFVLRAFARLVEIVFHQDRDLVALFRTCIKPHRLHVCAGCFSYKYGLYTYLVSILFFISRLFFYRNEGIM